jgi:hypothetical protein
MSHPRSAAAVGIIVATLPYMGWPAFCAISTLATTGAVLVVWVLSDQAHSDRAAALVSAWHAISTRAPEVLQNRPARGAVTVAARQGDRIPRCG